MRPLILPLLEVGHNAVHDVWLRREQVEGLDIVVGRSSIGDLLDVWSKSGETLLVFVRRLGESAAGLSRTGNVLVEDGVFVEDVV